MDFIEIFFEYLESRLSASSAEAKIKTLLPEILASGRMRDYVRASMCLTYFKRYRQYNSGQIKAGDLLLFMRDFVLFVGRFRFPKLITDVTSRDGAKLGIYVTAHDEIDVVENYKGLKEAHIRFVRDVYDLNETHPNGIGLSSGDMYVRRFTKFDSYRSLEQKLAVHCALELPDDYSLLVSLPTGGGKSLITQMLAAFEQKLTIVVVPTVSLAKDQYLQAVDCILDESVKKNVFCYQGGANNSSMIEGIRRGTARLVFTSPEAILKSTDFNNVLRNAAEDRYLHNVVIDEAHIVPDWGVNFRPDFQIFSVVLRELREISQNTIRTYMLSATLSDDVVKVLFDLFGGEGKNAEFRCDALRREPRYIICDYRDYVRREREVIEMVKYLPKPLIVYVIEPKTAVQYCKLLKQEGFFNVHAYTGDTSDNDRESLLEKWKNNDFDVMVATSAFGMGVDKSNVRTIIHACVPENLSRFYQEVGRAGRDGLPSLSVLAHFVSKDTRRNDLSIASGMAQKSILTKERLLKRFESILSDERNIIEGDIVTADLNTVPTYFSKDEEERAGNQNMCWNTNTLLLLHRRGYINIRKAAYDPLNKTYLFTFRMNDINLLHDRNRLDTELSEDRQQEYDMRVAGYHKMAEIVQRPTAKCWAKQFASLFPFAEPLCSGCPVDPEGTEVHEEPIRIRKDCLVEITPDPPGKQLRRHMGILKDMLVPVEDYENLDLKLVADKTMKLGLVCMVYPDHADRTPDTDSMTLRYSEFLNVSHRCPWILRNGIMIVLCDDGSLCNKVFESANRGVMGNYRKVWCCKLSTRIASRNRPINEFLNCHTCALERL